ncbi:TPA: hypothetical protein N0F65_007217 [Lagenidium giganteum]|uniref:Uncharacterized protein n=1 Tax=Lagenidium giganteum TaxID=4803 RepID=A0AAV2Z4V4_9STRA|nr:TPA: hypothetical protein N0F65_007217 [Lagenidium giganteum]
MHKCFRSGQHESLSAYDIRTEPRRCWVIATEEGVNNVRVCRYENETAALAAFDRIWCCRVLYDPTDEEVKSAGVNGSATCTIRRVMARHYFACSNHRVNSSANWLVATEEGIGNVCYYPCKSEREARAMIAGTSHCRQDKSFRMHPLSMGSQTKAHEAMNSQCRVEFPIPLRLKVIAT